MVSYLLFPIQIINVSYVTVILNCMEMVLIEVANVFLTAADTQFVWYRLFSEIHILYAN